MAHLENLFPVCPAFHQSESVQRGFPSTAYEGHIIHDIRQSLDESAQRITDQRYRSGNHQGSRCISSLDLMEQASLAFIDAVFEDLITFSTVIVVCGPGNNGGDGLVIARHLSQRNCQVEVWDCSLNKRSADNHVNYLRLPKFQNIEVKYLDPQRELPVIQENTIIIDALFGSGVRSPLQHFTAKVVAHINASGQAVYAVDMPSGLTDQELPTGPIIRATKTVSFEVPKFNFFLEDCAPFVGEWQLVDIGLDQSAIAHAKCSRFFADAALIRPLVSAERSAFAHKGHFGHTLLIVGSQGMMGAAILSCRAALRAGAGLVTCHVPKSGRDVIHLACPEAIVSTDDHEFFFSDAGILDKYDAIGIGCGLQTKSTCTDGLKKLLEKSDCPLILDADALNIVARMKWLDRLPSGSIITPHPGEFDRLFGPSETHRERLIKQEKASVDLGIIIVLKGHFTSIAFPDGTIYFNATGNPGMATGGSGDALLGIIASLLGQYKDSLRAVLVGVYWHGLAGDMAADELSQNSVLASDIIEYMGRAHLKMCQK